MPSSTQERARAHVRVNALDQDEAFEEFAVVYALRLARSLAMMANTVADRLNLARQLLPILGVDTEPRPTRLAKLSDLLATVAMPVPARAGPTFRNLDYLASVLRLNPTELAILELAVVVAHHGALAEALQGITPLSRTNAARKLAIALDCDPIAVLKATGAKATLIRLGFLGPYQPRYSLDSAVELPSDVLLPLTEPYPNCQQVLEAFVRVCVPSALKPEDFPQYHDDFMWLQQFLCRAVPDRVVGVNVLLYGRPGTGKTEFAKVLAQAINCRLAEVRYDDHEGIPSDAKGRLRAYQLAQACFERHESALVLFDEAEDVFGQSDSMSYSDTRAFGKGFMNSLLESNAVPTIWISNSIDTIDPAYRRRFDYSIEFVTQPIEVRRNLIRGQFVGLPLADDDAQRLAQEAAVLPGQIARAARAVRIANVSSDMMGSFVERSIKCSSALLELGPVLIQRASIS